MMPTEKPSCNPIRSLAHAMAHGPINPPNPAKVKRMPRIEFVLSGWSMDTAAVKVGKMIEKKSPVMGRRTLKFVKVPAARQTNAPTDANKIARRYPSR